MNVLLLTSVTVFYAPIILTQNFPASPRRRSQHEQSSRVPNSGRFTVHGSNFSSFTGGSFDIDFNSDHLWVHSSSSTTTPASPAAAETCTCPTSSEEEIEYDPRYQAETIEEAILNFPDLTNPDAAMERLVSTTIASKRPNWKRKCDSDECRVCSSQLLDRIQERGLVSSSRKKMIARTLGIHNRPATTSTMDRSKNRCNRYRFTKNIRKFTKDQLPVPSELRKWVQDGNINFARLQQRKHPHRRPRKGGGWQGRFRNNRHKRQTENDTDLGTSYELSCVNRGDPETEDEEPWVVTCSMCWTWRVLPEEYFPRIINELKCNNDTKCLSGYGMCHQRSKNLKVRKGGRVMDVPTNSCCDCKVLSGSAFHSFVAQ